MKFDGLRNLASGKTARQSSTSKLSQPDDASRALADDGKRDFAFHTNKENNPWWQVDLGAVYPLYYIVIGNRRVECQERAITLTVETSLDGQTWQLIHTGLVSWDDDLIWPLAGQVSARFVRLSLREKTCFHLAKVEIWGTQDNELKLDIDENNTLWMETKSEGLHEVQGFLVASTNPTEMILDLGDFYPIWVLELSALAEAGFDSVKDLKIETSADGHKWWLVHEGLLFWAGRLYYPLQGEIMARFIKISRPGMEQKFRWPQVKAFTRRQPELQVWATRSDGLGARLMALLNAMYMAKLLGCEYKVVWTERNFALEKTTSRELLNNADETFDANFMQAHRADNEQPNNASILRNNKTLYRRHLLKAEIHDRPGRLYSTFIEPDFLYNHYLRPHQACFKSLFESLSFSPTLQEVVTRARQTKLPPNYIAFHLRSGELIFGGERNGMFFCAVKLVPLPLVKLALEKLSGQNAPIILFGQDSDTLTYFRNFYNVSLAPDYRSGHNFTPTQCDLFDLVLMSRASSIYAAFNSTYSICASLIGNNIKRIACCDVALPEEQTQYIKTDLKLNAACYHPLYNSFSYLYLYQLNHLTATQEELAFYLDQARIHDPANELTNILHAVERFKFRDEAAGEELLGIWLKPIFDLTQQTIQYRPNRFLDPRQSSRSLNFHLRNYFQPLAVAAKQGYPNAAAFMSIMHDLMGNKEQAMLWRGIAFGAKAAQGRRPQTLSAKVQQLFKA